MHFLPSTQAGLASCDTIALAHGADAGPTADAHVISSLLLIRDIVRCEGRWHPLNVVATMSDPRNCEVGG